MRQSVFAVYSSASSRRSSQNGKIDMNRGAYLWPKLVKRPIAIPNRQIIWTRRKRTSLPLTQEKPLRYSSLFYSTNIICFTTCQDLPRRDSLKTNLFLAWVNSSCLWFHTDTAPSWLLALGAPLTIDYKTLKNKTISVVFKLGSLLYKIPFPCISVPAVLRLFFLFMIPHISSDTPYSWLGTV